jgi:hypothetical protein
VPIFGKGDRGVTVPGKTGAAAALKYGTAAVSLKEKAASAMQSGLL